MYIYNNINTEIIHNQATINYEKRSNEMSLLQIQFILAGFFFGAWPLFMNRSGLSGILSSLILCGLITLFLLPLSINEFKNIENANWVMVLSASAFSALGMILLGKGLFSANQNNVSSLFITLMVAQATVPAVYKIILTGGNITIKQILGFATAIMTAILLG